MRRAQSLQAGGDDELKQLKELKGAAFDKAYIDNEVAYHQAVIDALDKTLIPERAERRAEERCWSRCARRSSLISNTRRRCRPL